MSHQKSHNIPNVIEAYPDHILARIEQRDRVRRQTIPTFVNGNSFELVIDELKLWKVGTINASFKGGTPDLHKKISEVASTWCEYGDIEFDFGYDSKTGKYREWFENDNSHIRVGFEFKGYWSLVGTDSRDPAIVSPGEITLNLSRFDEALPPGWAGTVLHEFGHALGFHHEHQSPALTCDFDWDLLYQALAEPPNEWPKWKVDHNLRQLPAGGLIFSPHDKHSIMHYSFPAWMFKKGAASPCFTERNNTLSEADKEMMAKAYPQAPDAAVELNERRIANLNALLDNENLAEVTRDNLQKHLDFLAK